MQETNLIYASFMKRFAAAAIDLALVFFFLLPIYAAIFPHPDHVYRLVNSFQNNAINFAEYQKQMSQYIHTEGGFRKFLIDTLFQSLIVGGICFICWLYRLATPGKMLLSMKIVDEATGFKPSKHQFIIRFLAYFVSAIPFLLGFIWIAFDKKRQGWHDKIAGTAVIISGK